MSHNVPPVLLRVLEAPVTLSFSAAERIAVSTKYATWSGDGSVTADQRGVTGEILMPYASEDAKAANDQFHRAVPGKVFGPDQLGRVTLASSTAFGEDAYLSGISSSVSAIPGESTVTAKFECEIWHIETCTGLAAHTRLIFLGYALPFATEVTEVKAERGTSTSRDRITGHFRGKRIDVRALDATKRSDAQRIIVVVHDGDELVGHETRALWSAIGFLLGARPVHGISETFDSDGKLLRRTLRGCADASRASFEDFSFASGAKVRPDFLDIFCEGACRALETGFPLDVMLEHLWDAVERPLDLELQSLLLAVHSAIEGWHRVSPPALAIPPDHWNDLKTRLIDSVAALIRSAPESIRTAVENGITSANRFGTGAKERRFFNDWQVDVSGAEEKYALALRNSL